MEATFTFTLPELVDYMEAIIQDRLLDRQDKDAIIDEIRQEILYRFGLLSWTSN